MKSHTTVLLPQTIKSISEELKSVLFKHKLDEDKIDSTRIKWWDYWFFPDRDWLEPNESIWNDPELQKEFSEEPVDVLYNSCFTRNLPDSYYTSGMILPNGSWIGLEDWGWRMLREPSRSNDEAAKQWTLQLRGILKENPNTICVRIITHS
ncbi:hypothetical protein DLM76_11565 [Leptospira yasudae]|uniref:hypothetical protein n=1 Tax=Leptospira yasudae TaxID=2202201 RepID=UPI000E59EF1D|nr:hypothetical protein [Leptospira yasudae]RHX94686.1 hypothetical protein DLM76_11565 [Leptospira yasudae]